MADQITLKDIDWVTFDCYGTLVDWEGAFGSLCYSIGLRNTPDPPPGPILRARWEEIQFELIQGPYQDYKKILAESIRAWCLEQGYQWHDSYAPAMTTAMRSMRKRLRARRRRPAPEPSGRAPCTPRSVATRRARARSAAWRSSRSRPRRTRARTTSSKI